MARRGDDSRENYRRHLPHQVPVGVPLFVTWNLKGSLPQSAWDELEQERQRLNCQPPDEGDDPEIRKARIDKTLFAKRDRILDSAVTGPLWLNEPAAAQIVVNSILFGAVDQPVEPSGEWAEIDSRSGKADVRRLASGQPGKADVRRLATGLPGKADVQGVSEGQTRATDQRYELFAYCVMPNHVHVLLKCKWDLQDVTQGIKGYTAYRINQLHNASGRTVWQDESYDHWCRSEDEFFRIIAYIENNPVAAGRCSKPEEWLWSSARWRPAWKTGEPFRMEYLPSEEQRQLLSAWRRTSGSPA